MPQCRNPAIRNLGLSDPRLIWSAELAAARDGDAAGAGAGRRVAAVSRCAAGRRDRDFRRRSKRRRRAGRGRRGRRSEAKVPIYTIGVGSTPAAAKRGASRPGRADAGVSGRHAERHRLRAGQRLRRPVGRRRADPPPLRRSPAGGGTPIASDRVALGADGEMVPVSFDIEPDEPGTFVFQLRVAAPADDGNPRDNQREAEVEVVDRKTRVLLFASGPIARLPVPPQSAASRPHDDRRRAAANGPARHLAGCERNLGRVSDDARGAVSNTTASWRSIRIGPSSMPSQVELLE